MWGYWGAGAGVLMERQDWCGTGAVWPRRGLMDAPCLGAGQCVVRVRVGDWVYGRRHDPACHRARARVRWKAGAEESGVGCGGRGDLAQRVVVCNPACPLFDPRPPAPSMRPITAGTGCGVSSSCPA
jgi:hypothetical protein